MTNNSEKCVQLLKNKMELKLAFLAHHSQKDTFKRSIFTTPIKRETIFDSILDGS